MTSKISFLALFITTFFLHAQVPKMEKSQFVTLNVIPTTAYHAPRWAVGYYRFISDKIMVGSEIQIGNYATTINFAKDGDLMEQDYFSIEISPEIFYILNPTKRHKLFVSSELFYIYHQDVLTNNHFTQENLGTFHYDQADYKRQKFGMNLNFGTLFNFSDRIGMMPKMGLGIKMRNVEFYNVINPFFDPYYEGDHLFPNIDSYHTDKGFSTDVNFNFDLMFLYKF